VESILGVPDGWWSDESDGGEGRASGSGPETTETVLYVALSSVPLGCVRTTVASVYDQNTIARNELDGATHTTTRRRD
jgi:hypothetical protein